MEIKRCARCGSMFVSENDVCGECVVKDNADVVKLRKIIAEGIDTDITKDDLAIKAGIISKNLDRYLQTEEFSGVTFGGMTGNIEKEVTPSSGTVGV